MLLTIGMATYDDFDGVYFTLEALKAYHDLEDVELVVVDTKKEACKETTNVCSNVGAKYYHVPEKAGTSASRNHVFEVAKGRFVLCIDCHVLLAKDCVKKLKEYLRANMDTKNLIQGPLLYDDQKNISTHFDPQWRSQMYGTWGTDPRHSTQEEIEIPMQGLGLFCMRKDVWPKFNANFRGFGGEEGYIHEKVRQNGGKSICLTWLKWLHRFGRPKGVPYPLQLKDRVVNYLIGWSELGMNYGEVLEFFKASMTNVQIAETLKDFSASVGFALTSSNAKDKNISKVAYILAEETSEAFKNFNWKHPKIAVPTKSLFIAMQDFSAREERYCLVVREDEILDEKTLNKLDEWIVIKQDTLKIAGLKEVETKTLQRKCHSHSYRIADDIDIDQAKSLIISKEFSKIILKDTSGKDLSKLAKENNIKPFVLINSDFVYRMNPHISHFDNVLGNLDFCDIREISWASKDKWCLDISALSLQTTLAMCQKGVGIVRVFDYQNQDKDSLKKELEIFGYANFVVADLTEDIQAPDHGKRALLVNYDNLPDYMREFSFEKQNSFIRTGDTLIVVHAEEDIRNVYISAPEFKIEFNSPKCLIATRT